MSGLRCIAFSFGVLLAALATPEARASQSLEGLSEAQAAYERGVALRESDLREARREFARAAAGFQAAVDAGADNAAIHFNLGNALIQSGDLGRGIASQLRARRLAPEDPSIAANLAHARSEVRPKLPGEVARASGDLIAWWRFASERTRFLLFAIAWLAAWSLAAVAVAGVRLRRPLPAIRTACAVIALLTLATLVADRWLERDRRTGVVIADQATLRKGNGDGFDAQVAEPLGPGVEFLFREERPGWLRVRLADGSEGWLRTEQVVLVDSGV